MHHRTRTTLGALSMIGLAIVAGGSVAAQDGGLTLEKIMRDPDWIGNGPEDPYWSEDGGEVFFQRKRTGSPLKDLHVVDLKGNARQVPDEELATTGVGGGDWTLDRARKVFERNGDIFVRDVKSGRLTQLTRTSEQESDPFFLIDESQVAYRRGNGFFVRDLDGELEHQPIDVMAEKDPEEKEDDEGYVDEQQERLFEIIRKREREKKEGREREESLVEADPSRAPRAWFLGDKITIEGMDLSPTGKAMLVSTSPKEPSTPCRRRLR